VTALFVGSTADGATLRVRVSPGASRDGIRGLFGDALKVAVRQPPEKGRANREVARLLAEAVAASPGDVEVVQGLTSRDKTVRFRGWDAATLRARVERILGG
jgi:uncharacterized protein (TIGR00251 family)